MSSSRSVAAISLRIQLPAHFLADPGQRAGFVLLVAFLVSFLCARTSARLMRSPKVPWWPGSLKTSSGVHVHHLVWGIVLMLIVGFLGFVTDRRSPATEILAALFGVGAGLTLDEFALWVHLRDVYWSEEGRSSFDAVIVATMIGGLILLGAVPFDIPNNASSVETIITAIVIDVLLAALAILKGKPLLGVFGILVPFFSLIAALRLASPRSPWARRFYARKPRKLMRAEKRWKRMSGRRRRLSDAIVGAPEAAIPSAHESAE